MSKAKAPNIEVLLGDCVSGIETYAEQHGRGFTTLAVCDPPFSFGMSYEAYEDTLKYTEYMTWTEQWLKAVLDCALHKHGTLWVYCPDAWCTEIDHLCKHKLDLHLRRRVVWAFTFGQRAQKNFTSSHGNWLYYTKAKTKYTFNVEEIRVPSARQLVYNDRRAVAGGKPPDDTWMLLKEQLEPYMTPDTDTWLESRICGTYKERRDHSPNQLPEPIVERIVRACSNPGDTVLDPFCGTGTTAAVCARLGRNCLTYDVGKNCVKMAQERVAAVFKKSSV